MFSTLLHMSATDRGEIEYGVDVWWYRAELGGLSGLAKAALQPISFVSHLLTRSLYRCDI